MPTAIITADLHLGLTPLLKIEYLKSAMLKHDPSVIILAGDIGESVKNFRECLSLFSDVKCPVGVVIGNHDLYAYDKRYPSEDLWTKVLPRIVKRLALYGWKRKTSSSAAPPLSEQWDGTTTPQRP